VTDVLIPLFVFIFGAFRLPSVGGRDSIPTGQIMNLVSNDVERFMMVTLFASYVIWAPLQSIAILIIGLYLIGPAFAVGIGLLLFVFIPLQGYLSKKFAALRSKVSCKIALMYVGLLLSRH